MFSIGMRMLSKEVVEGGGRVGIKVCAHVACTGLESWRSNDYGCVRCLAIAPRGSCPMAG